MSEIRIENLVKRFGDLEVIHDISLTIDEGDFCVFVGPSGCGKSTLLRMIAGLEEVSSGQIIIGGRDVTHMEPYDRQLSMVFQSYALYPHMNVRDNIAFALRTAKMPEAQISEKIKEASRILHLDGYLDRKPSALSGGQRQRVAIGRAIVREPAAFLFDEPLSNLDAALRAETRVELAELHHSLDATTIYVTHDQTEAMTLADKIVVLQDGRIMQVGSPTELYERPANVFVAQFLGSPKMNVLEVEIQENGIQFYGNEPVPLSHSYQPQAAQLGIRPEALRLTGTSTGMFSGTVTVNEFHGGTRTLVTTVGSGSTVTLQVPANQSPDVGEIVGFTCDHADFHFFGADGQRLPSISTTDL